MSQKKLRIMYIFGTETGDSAKIEFFLGGGHQDCSSSQSGVLALETEAISN
jgi:hypothetical protein